MSLWHCHISSHPSLWAKGLPEAPQTFALVHISKPHKGLCGNPCTTSYELLEHRSVSRHSLSYRKFIECRDIGLFRISNSISYRTSHIEYLDILKTNDFFVFFRRKFQKFSENSENSPKIQKTHEPKSSTTTTAPKIPKIRQKFRNSPKIRRKFLKKKVFFEALISYRIVSYREKNPHIVSISYRMEKKLIATQW